MTYSSTHHNDDSLACYSAKSFFSWTPETANLKPVFKGYEVEEKTASLDLSKIEQAKKDRDFVNSLLGY